jgi:hypothetical protein
MCDMLAVSVILTSHLLVALRRHVSIASAADLNGNPSIYIIGRLCSPTSFLIRDNGSFNA